MKDIFSRKQVSCCAPSGEFSRASSQAQSGRPRQGTDAWQHTSGRPHRGFMARAMTTAPSDF